jgi:tetratricopeptide (TPR) repeat protein
MRPLNFLVLLLALSCASAPKDKKAEITMDSVSLEAMNSWQEERLARGQDELLMGCFQGKQKETLATYRQQFEKQESRPYYWLNIGNCYYLSQDEQKAEFFYQLSVENRSQPEVRAMSHNNLGLIALRNNQWEEGRFHLKKAIELYPKLKEAKINLAQLYLQFGHYDEAITLLKNDVSQNDAEINFSLANGHLFKGDLSTARLFFSKIPSEEFKREDFAITYSLFLMKSGDLARARKILATRRPSSIPQLKKISADLEALIERRMNK